MDISGTLRDFGEGGKRATELRDIGKASFWASYFFFPNAHMQFIKKPGRHGFLWQTGCKRCKQPCIH